MRILYFHQYFTTPKGRGGVRSYRFARKLLERGHKVTMVSVFNPLVVSEPDDFSPTRPYYSTIDGIDSVMLPLRYSNRFGYLKRTLIFLKFACQSTVIALRYDYDLIFASSTPLTASIPGIFAKTLRRKPFVFEVRDLWPELPREMGVIKNPLILWMMSVLEWWAYHASSAAIGLSPGIVRGIERRGTSSLEVKMIPNGCDLDLFRQKPSPAKKQVFPGLGQDDFIAMFPGAHGRANGLDAVLDAANILKAENRTEIKLVFIGDGQLKAGLQQRAHDEKLDNCLFLDPMPSTKVAELMNCADVGLMILANIEAFYYGTSPNKFFDYISAGLPVVTNYPGWLADLIHEYECGVATPPDDAQAFADTLIDLAGHPEKLESMAINARKLATLKFDRHDLATQFVDFIEETYAG